MRRPDPDPGGKGGNEIQGRGGSVTDRRPVLVDALDQHRHPRHLGGRVQVEIADLPPAGEPDPVVGRHRDHRGVEATLRLQPVEDGAELAIGVLQLESMASTGQVRQFV